MYHIAWFLITFFWFLDRICDIRTETAGNINLFRSVCAICIVPACEVVLFLGKVTSVMQIYIEMTQDHRITQRTALCFTRTVNHFFKIGFTHPRSFTIQCYNDHFHQLSLPPHEFLHWTHHSALWHRLFNKKSLWCSLTMARTRYFGLKMHHFALYSL